MVHKFCVNYLTELYKAIKEGSVADIKKVEHQLTREEECVACAYALRARGEAKKELLKYLASGGFGQLYISRLPCELKPRNGAPLIYQGQQSWQLISF